MTHNYLIPILVIAVIVVINVALWTSITSKHSDPYYDLLKKTGRSIQKPFEKEDASLQELSERVNRLKQKSLDSMESDRNDQSKSES